MSDSEQCSNQLELDLISLLVNFSCELGPIMTLYDFLWARSWDEWFWAMFEQTWTWHNFTFGQLFMWIGAKKWPTMTSYGLDEWFWPMLQLTWTWPNFTFGQLFMWIGANNDQTSLSMGYMSDSEQCSNRLELDLISLLVNLLCELGPIMTIYDFLWVRWVILSNVWTDLNLTFLLLVNFSCELGQKNDQLWLPMG